ncbi:uncharacterized protein LOC101849491 [Aplysia californica]|uniref:Uncharacterized protein LOC101849491 n=1 Tax=Aplysia californica TaxID=6500 RepID=A0ABM0K325_APLCA|nr:uncharacterized protein LOC101849491 [Aplysia californica]
MGTLLRRSETARTIQGLSLLLLVLLSMDTTYARSRPSLECNPHQVKMSCLMGCFGCFEAFGVQLYDMAACCRDCRLSDADVIDDGPTRCSPRYIRRSWLKRIG